MLGNSERHSDLSSGAGYRPDADCFIDSEDSDWGFGTRPPLKPLGSRTSGRPEKRSRHRAQRSEAAARYAARRKNFTKGASINSLTELGPYSAEQSIALPLSGDSSSDCREANSGHESGQRALRGIRPSLIVPDLDLGSASEAGYRREDRAKHRNRRRASFLRLGSLHPEGHPAPFADFQRFFPITSEYDRFLRIPLEEKYLRRRLAPVEFLSKGLRKRNLKPSDERGRKSKTSRYAHPDSTKLNLLDEIGTRSDDLSCVGDLDGWYSSSIPASVASEGAERAAEGTATIGVGAAIGGTAEPAGGTESLTEQKIGNNTQEDFFTVLFSRAQENPDVLLQGTLPDMMQPSSVNVEEHNNAETVEIREEEARDGTLKVMSSIVDGVVRSRPRTDDQEDDYARSQFAIDILAGLAYAGVAERARYGQSQVTHPETKEGQGTVSEENQKFARFEEHTKRFGSRMLEKMGFTGRLGAAAQGIEDPIEGKPVLGRLGLGTKSAKNVENVVTNAAVGNSTAADDLIDTVKLFNSRKTAGLLGKRTRVAGADSIIQQRHVVKDDVYTSRHKRYKGPSLLQEDENWLNAGDRPGNERLPAKPLKLLDADDDIESDCSSTSELFDSGRRGILVEFDVLIRGSHERRLTAFANAIRSFPGIQHHDLRPLEGRDLGDEEAVREILKLNAIEPTTEVCEDLLDRLDHAFEELPPPTPSLGVLATLKRASQMYHIGVMHRGTRTRLNRELKSMNLARSFVSGAKMALDHSDLSPYERSWRELLSRIGVPARQTVLIGCDHGMNNAPSFIVAGRILGARTVCVADINIDVGIDDVQDSFDSDITVTDSSFADSINFETLFESTPSRPSRRRVLALYCTEGLWYAGAEQFRSACKRNLTAPVFVRYFKWNNCEWVDPSNIVALPRRYFRVMSKAGFPGLLDSADVADMV